jgi:hypothetical protein
LSQFHEAYEQPSDAPWHCRSGLDWFIESWAVGVLARRRFAGDFGWQGAHPTCITDRRSIVVGLVPHVAHSSILGTRYRSCAYPRGSRVAKLRIWLPNLQLGRSVRVMTSNDLTTHPIHLGLGATAVVEPLFTGEMEWYAGYGERHGDADGVEGRLVSMHTFSESWDVWEMHPVGSEVVLCVAGSIELVQEFDGAEVTTALAPGEYAINTPGTWHTANVTESATALFITAGEGTEHRGRA